MVTRFSFFLLYEEIIPNAIVLRKDAYRDLFIKIGHITSDIILNMEFVTEYFEFNTSHVRRLLQFRNE